jgi:hypothetical protein
MRNALLLLFVFAVSACAPSNEAVETNAQLSSLGSEAQTGYQTLSTSVQAASAGIAPQSLGDVSTLTDDQIVAKLEEGMLAGLEKLKKQVADAEAEGKDVTKIKENLVKLEAAIEKLIAKLDDPEFRKKFVDGIRNRPSPEDVLKHAANNAETKFPAQFCTRLAEDLASGKIPEALRERVKKDLETRCSK